MNSTENTADRNVLGQTAQIATPFADRIQNLEFAIQDMDALATQGLRQITGIAKLALAALESPDTHRHPDSLAQALNTIWWIAENTDQCFSDTAERAGSKYRDHSAERRGAARRASQEA